MVSLSNLPNNETFVSHTQNALKSNEIKDSKYIIEVELEPLSVNALLLEAAPLKVSEMKESDFGLKVFPNPAAGNVNLEFNLSQMETVTISLYNSSGQKITNLIQDNFYTGKQKLTLNLSAYPDGMYWLQMNSAHRNQSNKIILQH